MSSYYNENNLDAAETLRELIKAGVIAHGDVDTRSIEDVTPNDVKGYTQCHWFAGIGGWSRALRLAGWPDSKFAWTGSCPCQPFSSAGKGAGVNDERHLWPAWMHLIRQCRPGVVVGEQVAAAIRHGWLDTVLDDLENTGYSCWAADLPAGGIGAPHLRERAWFVGRLENAGHEPARRSPAPGQAKIGRTHDQFAGSSSIGPLADSPSAQLHAATLAGVHSGQESAGARHGESERCGDARVLARTDSDGCEPGSVAAEAAGYGQAADASGWDDCVWIPCTDGKWRPTQPRVFPLAHGIPKGMGPLAAALERLGVSAKDARSLRRDGARLLRSARAYSNSQIKGYGNAIVPQVAAEFIMAVM